MYITINLWYVIIYMIGYFMCLLIMTQCEKDYRKQYCKHLNERDHLEDMRYIFSIMWPVMIPVFGSILFLEKIVMPFSDWFNLDHNMINGEEELAKCKELLKENNII